MCTKSQKINDLYWFDLNRGEQFNAVEIQQFEFVLKKTFDGQVDIQSKNSKPLIIKKRI